jgi:hypothetical protein
VDKRSEILWRWTAHGMAMERRPYKLCRRWVERRGEGEESYGEARRTQLGKRGWRSAPSLSLHRRPITPQIQADGPPLIGGIDTTNVSICLLPTTTLTPASLNRPFFYHIQEW